jgi:lipoate-protein ligase A
LPLPAVRTARTLSVTSPALVLGSSQADVTAKSVDVVRRRSGGGAVLVAPGDVVWVDVFLPRGDALWHDDVGRAFWWLGDAWARALGIGETVVHRGAMVRTALSDLVCFAGLGPGEVTVAGAKVVGMAQRRTREGALFQCAVPLRWDPGAYAELLGLDSLDIPVLAVDGRTADEIAETLVAQLPD